MTILEAYRACLIEMNKVQAPSLLLDDFVYLFNKLLQQYLNKKYNSFEMNQQATDDLRALTKSVKITADEGLVEHDPDDIFELSYDCPLPLDYVHILNVVCEFEDIKSHKCEGSCHRVRNGANKLDTNQWSTVITNYYMKPSVKQPYYYIINIDDPINNTAYVKDADKLDGQRYGNSFVPIMLIKCGNNIKDYKLIAVYVDYLRSPKRVNLTKEQLDAVEDTTQILEFSDYVIYEIINGIVLLQMENGSNQRLQTYPAVNTTIPTPGTTK